MTFKFSFDHENSSIRDISIQMFKSEAESVPGAMILPAKNSEDILTRDVDFSLILEIVGGLEVIAKVADVVAKFVYKRKVIIKIENKRGDKMEVITDRSQEQLQDEIKKFLAE